MKHGRYFLLIRNETNIYSQMTPKQQFVYVFLHIIRIHGGLISIYWKVEKTIGFGVRT